MHPHSVDGGDGPQNHMENINKYTESVVAKSRQEVIIENTNGPKT